MKINELIEDPDFFKCLISAEVINFTNGNIKKKLTAIDVAKCFDSVAKKAFKEGAKAALKKIGSNVVID